MAAIAAMQNEADRYPSAVRFSRDFAKEVVNSPFAAALALAPDVRAYEVGLCPVGVLVYEGRRPFAVDALQLETRAAHNPAR